MDLDKEIMDSDGVTVVPGAKEGDPNPTLRDALRMALISPVAEGVSGKEKLRRGLLSAKLACTNGNTEFDTHEQSLMRNVAESHPSPLIVLRLLEVVDPEYVKRIQEG